MRGPAQVDLVARQRLVERSVVACTVVRRGPVQLKHGHYTREIRAERRRIYEVLRQSRKLVAELE